MHGLWSIEEKVKQHIHFPFWSLAYKVKFMKNHIYEHELRFTLTHHESLLNAKVIMDDFGQRGQAVGGAGGITMNSQTDKVNNFQTIFGLLNIKIDFLCLSFVIT